MSCKSKVWTCFSQPTTLHKRQRRRRACLNNRRARTRRGRPGAVGLAGGPGRAREADVAGRVAGGADGGAVARAAGGPAAVGSRSAELAHRADCDSERRGTHVTTRFRQHQRRVRGASMTAAHCGLSISTGTRACPLAVPAAAMCVRASPMGEHEPDTALQVPSSWQVAQAPPVKPDVQGALQVALMAALSHELSVGQELLAAASGSPLAGHTAGGGHGSELPPRQTRSGVSSAFLHRSSTAGRSRALAQPQRRHAEAHLLQSTNRTPHPRYSRSGRWSRARP